MGEEFLERQHRQIRRCIDRDFQRFLAGPDLFSGVPPSISSDVIGLLMPGQSVKPGQRLVHFPQVGEQDSFTLSYGKSRVVELFGEASASARQSKALSAEVTEVFQEEGIVALKFHPRYEKH